MAAMMSRVATAKIGALPIHTQLRKLGGARLASNTPRLITSIAGKVRCEGGKGPLPDAKEIMGRNTKNVKSVFGTEPTSGSLYPRAEVERRPETGSTSFWSVFAFDGAAPETINCRLAMLGFVCAAIGEKTTGLTVLEQLFAPGQTGLLYFLIAVQVFTYASLVPIMNGESTDARSLGPFTAKAERWNGRLAMIGFISLIVTEIFTNSAIFY